MEKIAHRFYVVLNEYLIFNGVATPQEIIDATVYTDPCAAAENELLLIVAITLRRAHRQK